MFLAANILRVALVSEGTSAASLSGPREHAHTQGLVELFPNEAADTGVTGRRIQGGREDASQRQSPFAGNYDASGMDAYESFGQVAGGMSLRPGRRLRFKCR